MICPKCSHEDTRVLDSRETEGQKVIRRRRECEKCEYRFTTFERVETTNLIVIKKDGSRENYDREKILKGIWKSCEKRKVTQDQINDLVARLEENLSKNGNEIYSTAIGEGIMEELKKLDEVAYIRFASVYREFKDVDSFRKELQNLGVRKIITEDRSDNDE